MTEQATHDDHDQRLKTLLKEFFEPFFQMFYATWAARFDFTDIEWLDKEVFLRPPSGKKRFLDLVAKLRLKPDAPPVRKGVTDVVALVHVEVESGDSVAELRPSFFHDYYVPLRRDTGLPVLPIGLFLRVGLDGLGWDSYTEMFWEQEIVRFRFAYIGLPGLDAEVYLSNEQILGAALCTLMRVTPERRAEICAEGLKRIALSGQNDYRRMLLAECLEAYADLDPEQQATFQTLLATEPYQEVKPMSITTFQRGEMAGKIAGQLELTLDLLEEKFGPLAPEVRTRVEALSPDDLKTLARRLVKAASLHELGLAEPTADTST